MIVWLASYPRSGNTLLRTILKQTMDLGSYSDEMPPATIGFTEVAHKEIGHLPLVGSWDAFYEMASASTDLYLVKTHLAPRDDQPVIYVVRDGRCSLVSYRNYHQNFFPEYSGGLADLVLGVDYYGGWSEHYTEWCSGQRQVLLLRYEMLLNASPALLQSIAEFLGHDGPRQNWTNPFNKLQIENADFFRVGKSEWQGAPEWSELVNGAFFLLHGDLMNALEYSNDQSTKKVIAALAPEFIEFVHVAKSIQRQKASLEKICQERLQVINMLDKRTKGLGVRRFFPVASLRKLISWEP